MNIKIDDNVLEAYNPSPVNRAITENELLGVLVGENSEHVPDLKKLAFGNILNSKNIAK